MIRVLVNNLNEWDMSMCVRISRMKRRILLDRLMVFFSRLGDGFIYPVITLVVWVFDPETARVLIPVTAIAFFLQVVIHKVIKHYTKRRRPFEKLPQVAKLVHPPDQFSFPSGHTAGAFVMALILAQTGACRKSGRY